MPNHEQSVGLSMDLLPAALIATIMIKLDVASICSLASASKTFKASANQLFSFLPSFDIIDAALPIHLLQELLPHNPYLRSLKIDCGRLDDSAIEHLIRPSLHELYLRDCSHFSGKLLSSIGAECKDLRYLCLCSVADKQGSIHVTDLENLLSGCTDLEALVLMFDLSPVFLPVTQAKIWANVSSKLTCLEIGGITYPTVIEMLAPSLLQGLPLSQAEPSMLPNIQKLCLSVDYITDTMVVAISRSLVFLTHLELQDAPLTEPSAIFDLTNSGIQQINLHGRLKHLSLVRSREFFNTYFKRVNDLGVLLMADKCSKMESICLGGFCRVSDTGFRTLLHSCSRLYKLKVSPGTQVTDLVFHDISATSLSLTHVSLRWCTLLTNRAIACLVSNANLTRLELGHCRNLGDQSLQAIGDLKSLKVLLMEDADITDEGLSFLKKRRVINSLVSLSVRGCKRLTDRCVAALFDGSSELMLRDLDLSNIPSLSDDGILLLAKSRAPITELRFRNCPNIGDTSVMALASMQVDDGRWRGSGLRCLDLYDCGGITPLSFRWLKKPYFPRLRWLGLVGCVNRDIVDALARNRPFLHVACDGSEWASDRWVNSDGLLVHEYEELDELEEWLEEEEYSDEEEEAESDEEMQD